MSDWITLSTVLVLVVVVPLWLLIHYGSRWRTARRVSADEQRRLAELWESAQRMESRIHALERVLDVEAPGWRARH